jgi:hypothetical protein
MRRALSEKVAIITYSIEKSHVFAGTIRWSFPHSRFYNERSEKGDTIMATLNPAQIEKNLKGVNYPVNKAELVKYVERNGADESVRLAISNLPNQSYDSLAAVNRAISAMQGNAHQDHQDHGHDQDRNHEDQSQQGKQKANR